MKHDELMGFWAQYQFGRKYLELFPEGGKGARQATAELARYASYKATAQKCRLEGAASAAQMYEAICEQIYLSLPEFAKWRM